MRFKGRFCNEKGKQLLAIVQSLQRLGSSNGKCILRLEPHCLRFVVKQDQADGGIQAFTTITQDVIFFDYIVESKRDNEISVEVMQGGVCMARGRREGGEVRGSVAGRDGRHAHFAAPASRLGVRSFALSSR
jgi:hypothetical protein